MVAVTSGVAVFSNLGVAEERSVGSGAVQIVAALGFDAFTTMSRTRHHAYLTTLGAKLVFDYGSPDIVAEIVAEADDAGR